MNRTVIAILTWNRLDKLRETLDTFFTHNGREGHDIFILDNGSNESSTLQFIQRKKIATSVFRSNTNLGVYNGTMLLWRKCHEAKYDFILNLQNDFPSIAPVPFKELENYLDRSVDVGFVRLNDKVEQKKNIVTEQEIVRRPFVKIGAGYKVSKYNYHMSFNPYIFKAWMVPLFYTNQEKMRERGIMEKFAQTGLLGAKIKPNCFRTYPQQKRHEGWIR